MEIFGFDTKHVRKTFSWVTDFGDPAANSRTWGLLVVTALVLLVTVSVFCIVIFSQVQAGNFASRSSANNTNETVTLDRQELNEAVSDLQKRRATFDLLRDRQPKIPNPSR